MTDSLVLALGAVAAAPPQRGVRRRLAGGAMTDSLALAAAAPPRQGVRWPLAGGAKTDSLVLVLAAVAAAPPQ
jgi:hypothetical protein